MRQLRGKRKEGEEIERWREKERKKREEGSAEGRGGGGGDRWCEQDDDEHVQYGESRRKVRRGESRAASAV